jgi:hypothetical protein
MDDTEFISENLHLFFDQTKNQNLFVFVQLAIASLIKDVKEFGWRLDSEQIVNLLLAAIKDKSDVRFVQGSFFSKVSLSDRLPNLLTFSSSADQWS